MKEIGVYIHLPFCNSKCAYCDFASGVYGSAVKQKYFERLHKQITDFDFTGRRAVSIYFGGGTPSSVEPEYITDIISEIRTETAVSDQVEITVECNPESFDEKKAEIYALAGVNRISFGLQSTDDALLSVIGRKHTASDFFAALSIARKYFANISADIMLGLPKQKLSDVSRTADRLIDEKLTHVSAYSLKVEKGTKLYREGYVPDDDLCADMYAEVCRRFTAAGLRRYEVSNFAVNGHECRHNKIYWNRGEYVGFGVSAHSFYDNTRYAEPRSINDYLKGKECEKHYIPPCGDEAAEETLMLALRTSEGLDIAAYNSKFGKNILRDKSAEISLLTDYGLISVKNDMLALTDKGFYVMNEIIVRLID